MADSHFDTVLVANRGEIAVRIIRACRDLGIDTVAVYSESDVDAEHACYADEAYNVGGPRAADSYLDQAAILDVAERAGADAIHPGYGFLAENASFARAVEETEGVVWIGPGSDAMAALGEKTNARKAMAEIDVPIVPGTVDPVSDPDEVVAFGEEHSFPVAIKAEGGGGGRGMKIVRDAEDVEDKLESAQREGEAYFDNDSVYLERYLENPRHVEVQIIADTHGNVCHIGERDCSLQRRHQKVIEEGPSPALSEDLRKQITEAAVQGAAHVGYANAGTVEFLVEEDPDRDSDEPLGAETDFYFLEVNTRIQVEHTVTEEIAGIDIVKEQLRVAMGGELSFAQADVDLRGHAMEFRINAENAAEEFQPARGGTLSTYEPPEGAGVRIDDAVQEGAELVTDYDSMVAKLVVWGRDRNECIDRSRRALREYSIEGVDTIVPFHRLMLEQEAFVDGTHTTNYIDEELDAAQLDDAQQRWGTSTVSAEDGSDLVQREFLIELDGRRHDLAIYTNAAEPMLIGGGQGNSAAANGETRTQTESDATTEQPTAVGTETDSLGDSGISMGRGQSDSDAVTAEMQGTILSVEVAEGDDIEPGDVLCVLEAMKMENDIVATQSGTVGEIHVGPGQNVDIGDSLVSFE